MPEKVKFGSTFNDNVFFEGLLLRDARSDHYSLFQGQADAAIYADSDVVFVKERALFSFVVSFKSFKRFNCNRTTSSSFSRIWPVTRISIKTFEKSRSITCGKNWKILINTRLWRLRPQLATHLAGHDSTRILSNMTLDCFKLTQVSFKLALFWSWWHKL